MQTVLAILIVLAAVAYVTWQWMPAQLHSTLRTMFRRQKAPSPLVENTACGTCRACSDRSGRP